MLFLVIEHFKNQDPKPVRERAVVPPADYWARVGTTDA
jgi:hypothetical protein